MKYCVDCKFYVYDGYAWAGSYHLCRNQSLWLVPNAAPNRITGSVPKQPEVQKCRDCTTQCDIVGGFEQKEPESKALTIWQKIGLVKKG